MFDKLVRGGLQLVAVAALGGVAYAQAALKWGPAPAVFPAGAKMAVVSGDPSKAAPFTVQLSMPAGYVLPPHFHPTAEHVTVKSGRFWVGMGDVMKAAKMMAKAAGDTATVPAKMHHYAKAEGATVVEVSAMGPFAMTYVKDMPKMVK